MGKKPSYNRVWLLSAREEKGYTQAQVANAAGIEPATYCYIEQGKREPLVKTAIAITDFLGVSIRNFITEKPIV